MAHQEGHYSSFNEESHHDRQGTNRSVLRQSSKGSKFQELASWNKHFQKNSWAQRNGEAHGLPKLSLYIHFRSHSCHMKSSVVWVPWLIFWFLLFPTLDYCKIFIFFFSQCCICVFVTYLIGKSIKGLWLKQLMLMHVYLLIIKTNFRIT